MLRSSPTITTIAGIIFMVVPCDYGRCSNDNLEPDIATTSKSDWSRVLEIKAGTRISLELDQGRSGRTKRVVVEKGKLATVDEASIVLMTPDRSTKKFHRDQIRVIRVRRPILKRLSGYIAAGAVIFGIYVLAEPLRGRDLDLNAKGHAVVNLGIAAPVTAGGFFLFQ